MRVLVCGGRDFNDGDLVCDVLDALSGVTHIIHGCCSGADDQGRIWAGYQPGVKHVPFEADWKNLDVPGAVIRIGKYGPYNAAAGPQRNQRMIDEGKPDLVVAFPGGSGTKSMINLAKIAGIAVREIKPC